MISLRRKIADRVTTRWKTRGTAIDEDSDFIALIELWIAGSIDSEEMCRRHAQRLRGRSPDRRREASAFRPTALVMKTAGQRTPDDDRGLASIQDGQ